MLRFGADAVEAWERMMTRQKPCGWVVTCEHASRAIPDGVDLRLSPGTMDTHVAWDLGAKEIAEALGEELGVSPFFGRFTRLFVDLNRSVQNPEVVPVRAFGVDVPGNRDLPVEDRRARIQEHHGRHWALVIDAVRRTVADRGACVHIAVHSFEPALDRRRNEIDVGVLFDPARAYESEVAHHLIAGFRARGRRAVPNEPYEGTHDGLTTSIRSLCDEGTYAGIEIEASHAWMNEPRALEHFGRELAVLVRSLTP